MTAKERHTRKLLEYLGNPQNHFCDRVTLATEVLGFAHAKTLYRHFTAEELSEIEDQALRARRSKVAHRLARVDDAVFRQAENGDLEAAKLVYAKFENWSPKKVHEVTGKDGKAIEHDHKVEAAPRVMEKLREFYGPEAGE